MDAAALGAKPIPGDNPAGFDAKYEQEYADVSAEIGKLGSAVQGGAVAWAKVAAQGQAILEQKSKDLQIAAYVGIAWQEVHGIEGLRDAVDLFLGLFETFWETAFPPLAKLRRRTNAFDWWHERAYADLQKYGDAPALPADMVAGLAERLSNLDRLAGERMPDAAPLRDMLEAVRRLPIEAAEPVPAPESPQPLQAEQAPTTPAPQPATPPTAPVAAAPAQPQASAQSGTAASSGDDAQAALKDFSSAGSRYALLTHRAVPEDPSAWQILRLALWSKVAALPPSTDRQTHIPPPDAERIAGLRRMLEAGKYLEAALGGEDVFAASLFCLDAQCVIDAALEGLGDAYAEARRRVREETARFVRRLRGVEQLTFDGGMPFADQETRDWLASLQETEGPASAPAPPAATAAAETRPDADNAAAAVAAEAERLAAAHQLDAALRLLEKAQGDSPAANMALRARQLRLLCNAKERDIAAALAQGLLEELGKRQVENWDVALALEVLLAARDAFALAKDRDRAAAAQDRIAVLRPSAALGWKK